MDALEEIIIRRILFLRNTNRLWKLMNIFFKSILMSIILE